MSFLPDTNACIALLRQRHPKLIRLLCPMNHPIHRIASFGIVAPYTLNLRFDDGLSRTIDFEPILEGELFGPLRDPALFAQASLDPEVHTVVWPTGADFDPAVLHDWPEHEAAFRAAAQRWSKAHAAA